METWQREYITRNLCELLEFTTCDTLLLTKLESKEILSGVDVDKIKSKAGCLEKTKALYDVVKTRTNGYQVLTKALFECKQSGAVKILLDGLQESEISTPFSYCDIPIEYNELLNRKVYFQGRLVHFQDVINGLTVEDLRQLPDQKTLEVEYVRSILGKKEPLNFVRDTVPPKPPFYIPRQMCNKIRLDPNIFKQPSKDVFVFKDIERNELTELASTKDTSTSDEQLMRLTSRFILLKNDVDWEELRATADTENKPIHLVKVVSTDDYSEVDEEVDEWNGDGSCGKESSEDDSSECENDNSEHCSPEVMSYDMSDHDTSVGEKKYTHFFLEESSGDSTLLSNFICRQTGEGELYISEEELIEKGEKHDTTSGICICDSPGAGKSWLLKNVARQVKNQHTNRIVVFLELPELQDVLKSAFKEKVITKSAIMELLIELVSPTEFGRAVLKTAFVKHGLKLELFCDAFDEIGHEYVRSTIEFLKKVKSLGNIEKLYITSRSHYKQVLEKALNVISYDILPFTKEIQCDFLVTFWENEFSKSELEYDKTRLCKFGDLCLEKLNEIGLQRDRDIMGNPLQCYILAHVYLKEAKCFSNPKRARAPETLPSTCTIFEMYQKFMDQQFEKCSKKKTWDVKVIKNTHVWSALKLISPQVAEDYARASKISSSQSLEFLSVGIMENSGNTNNFVHLIFAEFLIAEYISDIVIGKYCFNESETKNIISFLKLIFSCIPSSSYTCDPRCLEISLNPFSFGSTSYLFESLNFYRFRCPVIMYFLDGFLNYLPSHHLIVNDVLVGLLSVQYTGNEVYEFLLCSIYKGYHCLVGFMRDTLVHVKTEVRNKFISYLMQNSIAEDYAFKLFACATTTASRAMCDYISHFLDKCFHCDILSYCRKLPSDRCTPLHVAIERTDYSMVEYLSDKISLENRGLLYYCAKETYGMDAELIEKKLEICKLLVGKCKPLLNEQNSKEGCSGPIITTRAHLDIINYLIKSGSSVYTTDRHGQTILTTAALYMKSDDYHKLICTFTKPELIRMIEINKQKCHYLVHYILRYSRELRLDTLQIILNFSKVDINEMNYSGNNLLMVAVEGNQSVEIAEYLVKQGANINLSNSEGKNILHIASKVANITMLKYLCSFDLPLNTLDKNGNSLLGMTYDIEKIELLVSKGAKYCGNCLRPFTFTIVHLATSKLSSKNFKKFVKLFLKDACGPEDAFRMQNFSNRTPLHERIYSGKKTSIDTVETILKIEGSDGTFDNWGNGILSTAIQRKHEIALLKVLIDHGVDYTKCNRREQTALHVAVVSLNISAVSLLLSLDIDVHLRDCHGKTASETAQSMLSTIGCGTRRNILLKIIKKLNRASI